MTENGRNMTDIDHRAAFTMGPVIKSDHEPREVDMQGFTIKGQLILTSSEPVCIKNVHIELVPQPLPVSVVFDAVARNVIRRWAQLKTRYF